MEQIQELHDVTVQDLGLVDYNEAYEIQKRSRDEVASGAEQTLIICEHPKVLTLGRLAKREHMLIPEEDIRKLGFEIYDIDRGGDITLHAPGQLVVYPILNLKNYGSDLKVYLNRLEQCVIDLLADFGIVARRFPGQTGVWVEGHKIASLGIGVKQWVSFHGLALNVNTELNWFSLIKPCGLDVEMTSMRKILGQGVPLETVKERLIGKFIKSFDLKEATKIYE